MTTIRKIRQHKHPQNLNNQKTKIGLKTILWTLRSTNKRNLTRENLVIAMKENKLRKKLTLCDSSIEQRHKYQHIQARMNKTQKSKCSICGDRDETINHINECSKLVQRENMSRHDCVRKVNHWKLSKKFKFEHANKWYTHNPESVQENETQKILKDINFQTDYLISARQPGYVIVNKNIRTGRNVDFAITTDHSVKEKESEREINTWTLLGN